MRSVQATLLLVLIAGCGAGEERPTQEPPPARPADHAAETPPPPPTSPAPTASPEATPPEQDAPPSAVAWKDCGRILSPLDRRPQRVEARVFDCRAARRVAVR